MSQPTPTPVPTVPPTPETLTAQQARGGIIGHKVRYVLAISVLLAVAAMVSVYIAAPGGLQDGPTSAPGPR
jgi:hypothetical protein